MHLMTYKNPEVKLAGIDEIKKTPVSKIGKEYRELEPIYFAFIDVLGFKATFDPKDKSIRKVFEYFNSLMEQMRCLNEDPENCYAGQTSDSLYFYTTKLNYLACFINVFLHFNIYAMSNNVFFRGGIAKGKLFVNKPYQFYGDCVINSFLLEDEIASMPRITIDSKTMNDLKEYSKLWVFDDDNRRHFLNPFSKVALDDISQYLDIPVANFQQIDEKIIKKIKSNIFSQMKKYEFNNKTYQKYTYLSESYDKFVLSM